MEASICVHRLMPFCFYFKNHLHFPNLNEKTHIFTHPKSCLVFQKYNYFYFLSLVGTPIRTTVQDYKQKLNFFENHKIAYFYIFRRSKKLGPAKNNILKNFSLYMFYNLDEHLYQICSKFSSINPLKTPGHALITSCL